MLYKDSNFFVSRFFCTIIVQFHFFLVKNTLTYLGKARTLWKYQKISTKSSYFFLSAKILRFPEFSFSDFFVHFPKFHFFKFPPFCLISNSSKIFSFFSNFYIYFLDFSFPQNFHLHRVSSQKKNKKLQITSNLFRVFLSSAAWLSMIFFCDSQVSSILLPVSFLLYLFHRKTWKKFHLVLINKNFFIIFFLFYSKLI